MNKNERCLNLSHNDYMNNDCSPVKLMINSHHHHHHHYHHANRQENNENTNIMNNNAFFSATMPRDGYLFNSLRKRNLKELNY